MPLKLDLKSGEKMIVNGAVLENVGPSAKILVHNMASILREKEILSQEEASTPAARVYFSLQCAYMFPQARADHLKQFTSFLDDYLAACPSAVELGQEIRALVEDQQYYKALRHSRNLIAHEFRTLSAFNEGMSKLADIAAEAEQDPDDRHDEGLEETS